MLDLNAASLVSVIFLSGCVTHEGSLQSARTLKVGARSHTVALHYLVDHDEDVLKRRLAADEAIDYGKGSTHSGLSYHQHYGLAAGWELAGQTSLKSSALGVKARVFEGGGVALALNPKWLFPTFSVDIPATYQMGLLVPASLQLTDGAEVFLVPAVYRKPSGEDARDIAALHAGFIFGKSDTGLILEWSFYEDKYAAGYRESQEQLKLAWTSSLSDLDGEKAPLGGTSHSWTILPVVGLEARERIVYGLHLSHAAKGGLAKLQLRALFGQAYDETRTGDEQGITGSRLFELGKSFELSPTWSLATALGYSKQMVDLDLGGGFHHLAISDLLTSLALRQSYPNLTAQWLAVGLAWPELYHKEYESGAPIAADQADDFRRAFGRRLRIRLLEIELFL